MNDDWFELLVAMLDERARFMVVGAHAVAVHGVPRATQDIDLWIDPSQENAERVWRALAAFGAPLAELRITPDDLATPGIVVQVGLPPNRIDLMTALTGLPDFASAWTEHVSHQVRGRPVPFLGRAALLRNKIAAGRTKDLADVEALGRAESE